MFVDNEKCSGGNLTSQPRYRARANAYRTASISPKCSTIPVKKIAVSMGKTQRCTSTPSSPVRAAVPRVSVYAAKPSTSPQTASLGLSTHKRETLLFLRMPSFRTWGTADDSLHSCQTVSTLSSIPLAPIQPHNLFAPTKSVTPIYAYPLWGPYNDGYLRPYPTR